MGAISARDMIEDALFEINVLGPGQPVNAGVEARAFRRLNNMLEALSLNNNKIYVDTEEVQTLTSGTARYTVGSGGDFDTNRPLKIYGDAFIRTSGGTDYPLLYRSQDQYRRMPTKGTTTRPYFFTYTPEFPLGKFSFYPTPANSTDAVHYRANVLLDQFATVTTEVTFPPAYQMAIMLSLAIGISAQNGKTVTPELAATAGAAWDAIEQGNVLRDSLEPVNMYDLILINPRYIYNNILTGMW
jgi:hypothetical protein